MVSIGFELTARCNLNCRHCYVNLPAGHAHARKNELSREQINRIFDQAVEMGTMWVLLTGGEPLLRNDFKEIYLDLRRKGLLVSLFTNATLITSDIAKFLAQFPPREIEITVYGATKETYERVSRLPGSYRRFLNGLKLLKDNGLRVTLKAIAMRSTVSEMQEITDFCEQWSDGQFRFDTTLHLRYDGDHARNGEILAERLSPAEVVQLEKQYPDRMEVFNKLCRPEEDLLIDSSSESMVFKCGAGRNSLDITWDGLVRPCSALTHPDFNYNLLTGTLQDAWDNHIPRIFRLHSERPRFITSCAKCRLIDLCYWCPAHAYLECGELDSPVDSFCQLAHLRAENTTNNPKYD